MTRTVKSARSGLALVEYFIAKGVQRSYVNGSSGECIYTGVEDRKRVLEEVMKVARDV